MIRELFDCTFTMLTTRAFPESKFRSCFQAFEKAWKKACSFSARTRIVIPSGYIYLIHPIEFGGHCTSRITLEVSDMVKVLQFAAYYSCIMHIPVFMLALRISFYLLRWSCILIDIRYNCCSQRP